jgi:UDP-4-amino-4,6-dideoxy-N-acetyl-beta-L-altrosamine N-acetyltransferase
MMRLRDLAPGDKDTLYEWRNLPQVAHYMTNSHTITPEEHERWFTSLFTNPTRKYWMITYDGADVGVVNLVDIDRQNLRCYWAFYIAAPSMRGKGIGSLVEFEVLRYVFEELGLHKLCGEVLDFNQPVLDLHATFGFVEEGRLRQHIRRGDTWHDMVQIGLLRDEWLARKPAIEARLQRIVERQQKGKQQ